MRQMTRIAARARGYALSWAPLVVLVQLAPMDAGAQRIPPRLSERGTEITVLDQSYTIHGNTARALLDQMQALGPGRGWTGFRYRYEWSFRTRPTLTSGGMESDRCTVDRFVVRYTVDAVYPKWNRPEDAPAKLIAAWEAFEEQIAEQWRERRDYMVAFAREATREVQRIEEPCLLVGQLANNAVRDLANRPTPMQRDMLGGQTRTRLRWPPEGFEELLPNRASA
ncbi:MAG: DUF922 domain-containing Zn-dependent protease, partial [Gemmatimonadetes bacterium]|nr:DUF922 domain-containing Zn-dependent protease [Gemmatimonadota bacterium]